MSQFQNQRDDFVASRHYSMMQGGKPWDYLPVLEKDVRAGDVDLPLQVLRDRNSSRSSSSTCLLTSSSDTRNASARASAHVALADPTANRYATRRGVSHQSSSRDFGTPKHCVSLGCGSNFVCLPEPTHRALATRCSPNREPSYNARACANMCWRPALL